MSDIENQEVEHNEPTFTATEQTAMEQGWRPKEEFEGEPDRFIDAAEFIRRGELFQKIDQQNRQLKQVTQTLEQFKQHHANVEKSAYDRAIKDLKAQRKAALAEGDVDLFDKLDEDVEALKDERAEFVQKQTQTQAESPQPAAEFQAWVNRNKWYENDVIMQGAADKYGVSLAKQGKTPDEVLKLVEAKIKEEFPHKFTNPNRAKASAVEAPVARGGQPKSGFVPTDMQRQIAKNFVRSGAFKTEKEYYAELEKMEKGN